MLRDMKETCGAGSSGHDGSELVFRVLEAGEAAKLVSCLRRCYGESHVDPGLYDAPAIDEAIASGLRRSAVAVAPTGEVVGHLGIALRRPDDTTADVGLTLVDPSYRGRGLAHRLSVEVGRMAIQMGLVGLHDYPVTVHGATQRLAAEHALTVGLLLDNLPADVQFNAMDAGGDAEATASLVRYVALGEQPEREVHLPGAYADLAARLYERGGLPRLIVAGEIEHEVAEPAAETGFDREHDERRGVLKLTVSSAGPSTAALEREALAQGGGCRATQVDIPLRETHAPRVAARLRRIGFFFGALLPEFRDGDVLRLQRLPSVPAASAVPVLESRAMRELADFVLSDAAEVSAGCRQRLEDANIG
jgi:GNAT superfamily N-acetyltransferase